MVEEGIEQELVRVGEYMTTTVGNSMRPMLRDRQDTVLIRRVEGDLDRGDVALYRIPGEGRYILHRVINVTKTAYHIVGDNGAHMEIVPKEWVIGYVDGFYRGERWISPSHTGYRWYRRWMTAICPVRRRWKSATLRLRAWGGKQKRRIKNLMKK